MDPHRPDHQPELFEATAAGASGDLETRTAAPAQLSTPTASSLQIAGYEMIEELHRGGQGVVFRAYQKSTKREVAIKVLHGGALASETSRRRFQREIELVARLKHPNIVAVFDSGEIDGGLQYCVMDYVQGVPLQQFVRNHDLALREVLHLFTVVCEAVDFAHTSGVIHRDLKPSNILVEAGGMPKVLDFGLAKVIEGPADSMVSLSGDIMGTLPYMAPEQALGRIEAMDARTDVYSLGIVLYQILTGHFPYPVTGSITEVVGHITETPPASPRAEWSSGEGVQESSGHASRSRNCPIDNDLETITLRCLAKGMQRRYQSASALAGDVRRYLANEPIEAKRDSTFYVLKMRSREVTRRHRAMAYVMALIASVTFSHYVGGVVFDDWTPVRRTFEQWAMTAARQNSPGPVLNYVRIIALTDQTDIAGLARSEGLTDVDPAKLKSLRRLHGRLLEKLALANPRVVALGLSFSSLTPYDEDFRKGVEALTDRGIPVHVGVSNWEPNEQGFPRVSPAIAPAVRWGGTSSILRADKPWQYHLAVQRPPFDPTMSLVLGAAASYRRPGTMANIDIDPDAQRVTLAYWRPHPDLPNTKQWIGTPESFAPSAIWKCDEDSPQSGVRKNDLVPLLMIEVPSDEVLSGATLEYGEALKANASQLTEWLGGHAVVIGDMRSATSRFPYSDGRELPSLYGVAAAIERLLNLLVLTSSGAVISIIIPTAGLALLGLGIGIATDGAGRVRATALLVLAGLVVLASFLVVRSYHLLLNPAVPILALLLAAELAAWIRRVCARYVRVY